MGKSIKKNTKSKLLKKRKRKEAKKAGEVK